MDSITIKNRPAVQTDKTIWQRHCKSLAEVAWQRFAIKRDRHGMYSADGSASWSYSEVTKDDLAAHFAGEITIGLGSTSIDDMCLGVAVDLDNHVDDQATNQNLDYAIVLLNKLAEHGVYAIVEDSDGKGGIHVLVLFSGPVPAAAAYRFINWITQGYEQHVEKIECFPKQPTVQNTPAKCGNYLRLPGKHHKRDHWSRFWGDSEWLNAEESVGLLLNPPINDPACLALAPEPPPPPERKEYDGPETNTVELARTALPYIGNDEYDQWLKVGQALHSEGDHMLSEWQHWSASSEKFKPGECESKWTTFDRNGSVGIGTVFHLASQNGWQRPKEHRVDKDVDLSGIEAQVEGVEQPKTSKPTFAGIDIAECGVHALASVEWIVDGIFSTDQPTLFGARSKCLKTTQLVDLAVALATGTDWLGAFKVSKKRRVLFITGEANNRAISRRLAKAAKVRGMSLNDLSGMIRVEAVQFPKLPNIEHCAAIAKVIEEHAIDVVIIDPLYRGIPGTLDTNKMALMGDAITNFAQWCQPASVIISHHVTKAAAREYGSPPELEDMTGAGVAESCGNWWLVGRNEKYQWDWQHDLCVAFGGRDEQAGGRRILFNEQTWTAEVSNLHEFIGEQQEAAQRAREEAKREKHYREIESARARVQAILRHVTTPLSKNQIEERRGEITQTNIRKAIWDMESDQTLTLHDYRDTRNRLQSGGYMLAENGKKYDAEFHAAENPEVEEHVPEEETEVVLEHSEEALSEDVR